MSTPTPAEVRSEDREARRLAHVDFDAPLILEAGAGTGKTSVLVGRVVSWCMGPGWERASLRLRAAGTPREPDRVAADVLARVVAITFTEAAAAEMAARISECLRDLRNGETPRGFFDDVVPQASSERQRRARALLGSLDQLTVCTIHAWCRRLLSENPLDAGLHPRFEVDADETGQAVVVREVMESRLLGALGEPGDPELVELAASVDLPHIEEALATLVREAVPPAALAEDPFSPERVAEFVTFFRETIEGLVAIEQGRLHGERSGSVSRALARTRAHLEETEVTDVADLVALRDELAAVWESKDLGRLGQWERGTGANRQEKSLFGERNPELAARARKLRHILRQLLELDVELLGLARRVLQPLLEEATTLLRTRGVETYAALLSDARTLLAKPGLARRRRLRIDQLLVDEFQDTDVVQCDVLRRLALEGPLEERPTLFLVGDPKQSIYGWRNADLRAYAGFVAEVEAAGGTRRLLSVNFRSAPAILDEVERVVRPVMQQTPGLQPAFEPLVCCEENEGAPGFEGAGCAPVEHWVSWGLDAAGAPDPKLLNTAAAELEAEAIARDLRALGEAGVSWGGIALLARSTGDLDVYLAALREAGIPYVVERDATYFQRREVIDVAALLRCILDPNDHLALVTWLRSASVGLPDAALLPLWRGGFPSLTGSLHGDDPVGRAAIDRLLERTARSLPGVPGLGHIEGWEKSVSASLRALGRARESFERDAPDVFVEAVRREFLLDVTEAARHLGLYRLANLDRFFRRWIDALEESAGNVSALLARLRGAIADAREDEEGRPRDAGDDAVHVLTIHKAKGLDFDHVYLLQHHKNPGMNFVREAARVAERNGRVEYQLFANGAATLGFHRAALDADAVEAAESVRTLYVAMTRARSRLVLLGKWLPAPSGRARNHAGLLAQRDPAPDLVVWMRDAIAAGGEARDEAGARWRFPALERDGEAGGLAASPSPELPSAEEVAAFDASLRNAAASARLRAARPRAAIASAREELFDAEAVLERRYGRDDVEGTAGGVRPLDRELARAVGTAMHQALERWDLEVAPAEALAQARGVAEASLASLVSGPDLALALEALSALIDRFVAGPLHDRLRAIGPTIVSRELPVLLSPEADGTGPVGFTAGAIDLLYRDPGSGNLVVADYKTDALESDEDLEARARSYVSQGAAYQRAVREAFDLDETPSFELWFLQAGRIVTPPVSNGPGR